MRRRLTDEEREIKSGAGVRLWRYWPFLALFIALFFASLNAPALERCTGVWLQGGGRGGSAFRALIAYPCSPYLLRGPMLDWLLFFAMWVPIPFAIRNRQWLKRHRAYWGGVRARDKERRVEKRAQKALAEEASKQP